MMPSFPHHNEAPSQIRGGKNTIFLDAFAGSSMFSIIYAAFTHLLRQAKLIS